MNKTDLRPLDYAGLARILDALTERVAAFVRAGHRIDLVAPILRSGAITGLHLASKLGVVRMLPLQYKYADGGRIERLFEPPVLEGDAAVSTILLVDTNTVSGGVAALAARDLRARYPGASIHLATAVVDHALPAIPNVESVLFGAVSNESRGLALDEAVAKGIPNDVWVFPWEDLDDQWREICAAEGGTTPRPAEDAG